MSKYKAWVSLTLVVSFSVLSVSGLLSFFLPYSRTTAAIHTVFGFLFVLSVLPHLWSNFRNLASYMRVRNQ